MIYDIRFQIIYWMWENYISGAVLVLTFWSAVRDDDKKVKSYVEWACALHEKPNLLGFFFILGRIHYIVDHISSSRQSRCWIQGLKT